MQTVLNAIDNAVVTVQQQYRPEPPDPETIAKFQRYVEANRQKATGS